MTKKKSPEPKISSQLFTKMVEYTVGAKVHLSYAATQEGNNQRGHLEHAKGNLRELSQIVERLRSSIGVTISRMPIYSKEDSRGRPTRKK